MSIAPGAPSPHRWNEIRRLPIYPEIRSLDDYEQAVSIGTGNAIAFLKEVNVLENLRIDDLRKVHFLISNAFTLGLESFANLGNCPRFRDFPLPMPSA